jgi:predicted secreted protein
MTYATCKFIKRIAEFQEKKERKHVPDNTRGIYVLLDELSKDKYKVVYVGMSGRSSTSGIYARLDDHDKRKDWTHFSLFEVHDNIANTEIKELEALILCIYRRDFRVNKQNKQLRYKPFRQISKDIPKWNERKHKLWL